MMTSPTPQLLQLRAAFDREFALPPATLAEAADNFLLIRLAGDPYALRVSEITGLISDKKIVPFPSALPEAIGIAGIRGGVVPVYSLAALLGYTGAEHGRWLASCGETEPLALAFHHFEGYVQIPHAEMYAADAGALPHDHVKDVAKFSGGVTRVVSISSILQTIRQRCGEARARKEQ
jgi:chemotaxis signal transduction protein